MYIGPWQEYRLAKVLATYTRLQKLGALPATEEADTRETFLSTSTDDVSPVLQEGRLCAPGHRHLSRRYSASGPFPTIDGETRHSEVLRPKNAFECSSRGRLPPVVVSGSRSEGVHHPATSSLGSTSRCGDCSQETAKQLERPWPAAGVWGVDALESARESGKNEFAPLADNGHVRPFGSLRSQSTDTLGAQSFSIGNFPWPYSSPSSPCGSNCSSRRKLQRGYAAPPSPSYTSVTSATTAAIRRPDDTVEETSSYAQLERFYRECTRLSSLATHLAAARQPRRPRPPKQPRSPESVSKRRPPASRPIQTPPPQPVGIATLPPVRSRRRSLRAAGISVGAPAQHRDQARKAVHNRIKKLRQLYGLEPHTAREPSQDLDAEQTQATTGSLAHSDNHQNNQYQEQPLQQHHLPERSPPPQQQQHPPVQYFPNHLEALAFMPGPRDCAYGQYESINDPPRWQNGHPASQGQQQSFMPMPAEGVTMQQGMFPMYPYAPPGYVGLSHLGNPGLGASPVPPSYAYPMAPMVAQQPNPAYQSYHLPPLQSACYPSQSDRAQCCPPIHPAYGSFSDWPSYPTTASQIPPMAAPLMPVSANMHAHFEEQCTSSSFPSLSIALQTQEQMPQASSFPSISSSFASLAGDSPQGSFSTHLLPGETEADDNWRPPSSRRHRASPMCFTPDVIAAASRCLAQVRAEDGSCRVTPSDSASCRSESRATRVVTTAAPPQVPLHPPSARVAYEQHKKSEMIVQRGGDGSRLHCWPSEGSTRLDDGDINVDESYVESDALAERVQSPRSLYKQSTMNHVHYNGNNLRHHQPQMGIVPHSDQLVDGGEDFAWLDAAQLDGYH
eukprot:GHVT01056972.1.p1 GENE.GHVT01056972.1~~GHVT01056972.1.p1  ORF type:complete len:843 (+),score=102.14 GHVT01056972.1:1329-3857(+)